MHISTSLHHLAAVVPGAIDAERRAIAEHQRRVRLLDRIDRAAAKVAMLEHRLRDPYRPSRTLAQMDAAQHALAHYTAAAVRAGLINPSQEIAS